MLNFIGFIIIGGMLIATNISMYKILYPPSYIRDSVHERAYSAVYAYFIVQYIVLIIGVVVIPPHR